MASTEFNIEDLGAFSSAQGQVKNYQGCIEDVAAVVKNAVNVVGDGSVFKGPAAKTCGINLDILNLTLKGAVYRYNKISAALKGTEITYEKGDNISKEIVANRIGELVGMDLSNLPIIAGNENGINLALSKKNPSFIIGGDFKNPGKLTSSQADFINKVAPGAIEAYNKYGILPSLTLAQAAIESGYGDSSLTSEYNNAFGIKAGSSWEGKTVNLPTKEHGSGGYYTVDANFRAYDSLADSIDDHSQVLLQDRYKNVISAKNYKDACHAVADAGYATSPTYANTLINTIEDYGLDQWDPK